MKVILAQPRGFCAGVVRAVDTVEQALKHHGAPVYVRHEIVHNQHVVDDLRAKGARFVENLNEVPANAVIWGKFPPQWWWCKPKRTSPPLSFRRTPRWPISPKPPSVSTTPAQWSKHSCGVILGSSGRIPVTFAMPCRIAKRQYVN